MVSVLLQAKLPVSIASQHCQCYQLSIDLIHNDRMLLFLLFNKVNHSIFSSKTIFSHVHTLLPSTDISVIIT